MALDPNVGTLMRNIANTLPILAGAVTLVLLTPVSLGGATARPDVKATAPLAFFDGASKSRGTITTLFIWTEAFTAGFEGTYDQGELKLDERFNFADGEALQRWDLFAHRDGSISGTVSTEIDGGTMTEPQPVSGTYDETSLDLDYDGYAPNGSQTLFHFNHAMRLLGDGTMTNDVTVSKYYLPLASSNVTFYKPSN
ncbi:hypothetical protein FP2506_18254 [Fulvimarina pelagi HTCC2506]|uniref:DUF3833 family protein n=1 Tax=Fulvimarina pelagi HTCC2506 TaxID=314231 RepID=Q0G0Y2_9HYPH|nr:DUF3833 family protein [Fulvimarina pelagi]EAU40857.1 hypothetical protein FP2506_18254 [Fulvimarina pelagi HTCC2506]